MWLTDEYYPTCAYRVYQADENEWWVFITSGLKFGSMRQWFITWRSVDQVVWEEKEEIWTPPGGPEYPCILRSFFYKEADKVQDAWDSIWKSPESWLALELLR